VESVTERFSRFSSAADCDAPHWQDSKSKISKSARSIGVIANLIGKGKHVRTVPVPA
jgi:hypothetical protein